MARYLSTDKLIESVKLRAMLPENQVTFKESDFLQFANEEMDNTVVPFVHSFREDYLVVNKEVDTESNETRYKIPHRAIASKLRDLQYKDNAGNIYPLTRIFIEDKSYFQFNNIPVNSSSYSTFIVEADEVIFPENTVGNPGEKLVFIYYQRPNQLVTEDRVARVTAINTNTNTITLDSFPSAFVGVSTFDIVSSKSPFSWVATDITPTSLPTTSNLTMTFSELPRYISVGDVVSLPEETIIPQIPVEVHSLLAQRVAMRCLEALGDTQGLTNASAKAQEMEQRLGGVLNERVEGAILKVNNMTSTLRNARRWKWW